MLHFPIICLVSIKLNKVLISLCAVTQHECMIGSMSDLQPSRPTIAFCQAHFLHEDLVMKTINSLLLLQVGNMSVCGDTSVHLILVICLWEA